MLHTTEIFGSKQPEVATGKPKQSLKQHLLEKMKIWINSLLEGERDEFLGRGRHVWLDENHNYRNGYRPRRLNFFGLREVELKVPRDRKGGVPIAVAAGEERPGSRVGGLLSRRFPGRIVDPGPGTDLGEAPGA